VLRQLREIKGVKEKSAGIFYGRNEAFVTSTSRTAPCSPT
jgi:hypothetical protein